MPRANRHFLPGYVWHITHRCHHEQFLLKFARDRRRYLHWVFEAKKRFGLSVLNYVVTCNHVHLLVKILAEMWYPKAFSWSRVAPRRNITSARIGKGAFWEDRYHATAIEADEHLHRCLVYIDLNMVRAGVVNHPIWWKHGGYREIQDPPERYALLDLQELTALCGFEKVGDFQKAHRQWIEHALENGRAPRDERWSEAIAVGSLSFVEKLKSDSSRWELVPKTKTEGHTCCWVFSSSEKNFWPVAVNDK
jgi:putative transposase